MRLGEFLNSYVWGELPPGTPRQRRLAALAWGGALLALAAWGAWHRAQGGRATGVGPVVCGAAGLALAALLMIPGPGAWIYQWVMRLTALLGWLLSTLVLIVFFYAVVTPMGWAMRALGKDPLAMSKRARPTWKPHTAPDDRRRYYRMF